MKRLCALSVTALIFCVPLIITARAMAGYRAGASGYLVLEDYGGQVPYVDQMNNTTDAPAIANIFAEKLGTFNGVPTGGRAFAQADALAAGRGLHVSATARAQGNFMAASATAETVQEVTVRLYYPNRPLGQPISVNLSTEIHGSLTAPQSDDGSTIATASFNYALKAPGFANTYVTFTGNELAPFSGGTYRLLTTQWINGDSFVMGLYATANAFARSIHSSANASAVVDYSKTFTFRGIESAYDVNGTPLDLSQLELMDDFGNNWATLVPEPTGLSLPILIAAGLFCRKRSSHPASPAA